MAKSRQKKYGCCGIWGPTQWYDFFYKETLFPPEQKILETKPMPKKIVSHRVIQPKAGMGFLRGQRNFNQEKSYEV